MLSIRNVTSVTDPHCVLVYNYNTKNSGALSPIIDHTEGDLWQMN